MTCDTPENAEITADLLELEGVDFSAAALKIITDNKDLLDLIANALLEVETITKEQIEYLVENGKMPEEDIKEKEELEKEKNNIKEAKLEEQNTEEIKTVFTVNKGNKDLPKAILVTEKQYNNLEKSLSSQKALCKFRNLLTDLSSESAEKVNLEDLINQANELYKQGDLEGAEKLFNRVSELNAQRNGN